MPFTVIDPATAEAAPLTNLGAPLTEGGMSLSDLRAELDSMLGGRADITTERYNLWLNLAYRDICTSLDIDELKGSLALSLVADQPFYTLPESVDTILSAAIVLPESENYNEGYPLEKIDLQSFRGLAPADGDPKMFFRMLQVLVLYPTPESARTLALDMRLRPLDLEDDTDHPILAPEWHEGILLAAAARGHRALREFPDAAVMQNDYVSFLRRRTDREAAEDENRVIGTSVPRSIAQLRNRVRRDYVEE
jgi:hypothetical protein